MNPSWWEFRHPQFVRGQPRLLSEIKRAVHYGDASNSQDVAELRSQVTNLKDRLCEMNDSISELTSLVSNLMVTDPSNKGNMYDLKSNDKNKKRKIKGTSPSDLLPAIKLESQANQQAHGVRKNLPTGPELAQTKLFRTNTAEISMVSDNDLLSWDDETLENLLSATEMEVSNEVSSAVTAVPVVQQFSPSPNNVFVSTAEPLSGQNMQDISQIISSLTPELQARFVDKLAETLGSHLSTMVSTPLMSSPAKSITTDKENNSVTSLPPETPAIAIPLASAALGAFFARLSAVQSSPSLGTHIHRSTSIPQDMVQSSA